MKKLITFALVLTMLFTCASCNVTDTVSEITDGNASSTADYVHTAFTASEEQMFTDHFGMVIPFIPNNEYTVEEYSIPGDYTTKKGILYTAFDNTQEEFDAYTELFSIYAYADIYTDKTGKLVHFYVPEDDSCVIMMSYIEEDGRHVVQVDVSIEVKGGTKGNGTGKPYDKLFTNEGAGLPSDPDGVYDVDFTKGEYITDVSNLAEHLGGCPAKGSPAVLVIPVQFSDVTAESRGYTTEKIVEALCKDGKTDYYSLYDYYYISSYGQLELDITVLDFWFTPEHDSAYYSQFSFMYEDEEKENGEQLILNEALDYLDDSMDLSQFDSDGNGTIDSVILVNTLELDEANLFAWAFYEFNFYKDAAGNYYEYDGVHVKDYVWLSFQTLHKIRDESWIDSYDNVTGMNTMSFIHEFGHMLGLYDYYDYASIEFPLYGWDIMDGARGDQNAYSKFNLGWITTSRLVVADESITLTLEDFSKNGDTILLANNWDDTLGAYQEYYILVYYTNNGLNAGEGNGYFNNIEGVVVYHVNSAMYMQEGKDHYDVYNRNTDEVHEYGTVNNLIEYVFSDKDDFVYGVGDTMSTVTDDYGNELMYNFTVDELTSEYATITVFKK